jgi:folate-dependent phosphoribosylglycinamide formyltransferase PurN
MARLKVAVLTRPGGNFVVHHLVKQLEVVGILVDVGRWGSAKKPPPRRSPVERLEYHWLRDGARGAAAAIARKLLGQGNPDPWARAAVAEAAHLAALDDALVGHALLARRTDWKQFADFDEIAAFHDVPIVRVGNINDDDAVATLKKWAPDLAVICGGRIVKPPILAVPRLGVLNKHSAILPKHRGLSAEYWCLYYEDFEHLGVTVHYVLPGLDDGNIVVQKRLRFAKGDTPATLRFQSEVIGREALVEAVRLIEATGTKGTPQDEAQATHNPEPTIATDRELYKKLPRLWARYGAE